MGSWGINENASEKEKLKANIADELHGFNAVGEISYKTYSFLYDELMDLSDLIYKFGIVENSKGLNNLISQMELTLSDLFNQKENEIKIELSQMINLNLKKIYDLGVLEK